MSYAFRQEEEDCGKTKVWAVSKGLLTFFLL